MELTTLTLVLFAVAYAGFQMGRARSLQAVGGPAGAPQLNSLPQYYGYYVALACLAPALLFVLVWLVLEPNVLTARVIDTVAPEWQSLSPGELDLVVSTMRNLAEGTAIVPAANPLLPEAAELYARLAEQSRDALSGTSIVLAALAGFVALRRIRPALRARSRVEVVLTWLLVGASSIALLTTVGIVLSVVFEALRFFGEVPVTEFLFGLEWSPQTAIRDDQIGSTGRFGAVPLFAGTLLITLIAMLVAVPVGLMTAIYLGEYSSAHVRDIAKPLLEVLAGIPTVVYGFFAAVTVAPWVRTVGESFGLAVAAESALAAGLVMGIMIIPLISSLSDDAIRSVPTATREGALALGSTRSEAMLRVVMPAALPGIVGGILLAVSRAIGETMIVVMAAGLAANLTANPFEAVTTVTVQIVTLLVGDQEFDSAKTLAAFALGLVLFVVTLVLNVIGLRVVRRYQEKYE